MYKIAITAFSAIVVALITASVLNSVPDPNRVIVNSLPNTSPDLKATANTALDIKDSADNLKDTLSMMKNIDVFMLAIGVPSAIVGGLVIRALR